MTKKLTLKELQKDKVRLEQAIGQTQVQGIRLEGALAYVMDNIKEMEVEDVRETTDT